MNPQYIQALIIGGLIGGAILLDDFIAPKPHKVMFHKGMYPAERMHDKHNQGERPPKHKRDKHSGMKHDRQNQDDMDRPKHRGSMQHHSGDDQHKRIVIKIEAEGDEQEMVFDTRDIPDLVTEEILMKLQDLDAEELRQELIETFEVLGAYEDMGIEFEIEEGRDH